MISLVLTIKTCCALIIPTVLGYIIIINLFRGLCVPLSISVPLAFGLGLGLITHLMLVMGILGIPYNLTYILLPIVIIGMLLYFYHRRRKDYDNHIFPVADKGPLPTSIKFLMFLGILYVAYNLLYIGWRSVTIPLIEWDAISFIGFKAKVFFYQKTLYQHQNLPHPSYPLHVSLAQTWISLCLNQWHPKLVKIIFPAYCLCFLSISYTFLRAWADKAWSLFGIVLIISSNFFTYHATIGYRDFTVMYYNCTVIILLILWQKVNHKGFLILAAIFAGLATFIKNEVSLYLAVHLLIVILMSLSNKKLGILQKIKNLLLFLGTSVGICSIYQIYRIAADINIKTYDTNLGFTLSQLNRVDDIFSMYYNNLFTFANWNLVWFVFFLSFWHIKRIIKNREVFFITLAPLAFFGLYALGLILSPQYEFFMDVSQYTVLSRVFLHFFPLSALAIVLINCPPPAETTEE